MTTDAVGKRLVWRAYIVQPEGTLERLPQPKWRDLKSRSGRRVGSSNQTVRIVYAFLLQDGRKPSLLLALEGTVWRFDDQGRVDYGVPAFDERRIGLATPFVADVLPQDAVQTGDRWQPDDEVRQAVVRDVWPGGLPPLHANPPLPHPEDCASLKRALAAVGSAGIARTMSRLVGELSLAQQTVERLMAALAVEPQTLLDLIAAEHQDESALVH